MAYREADSNVAFTVSQEARIRLIRCLDALAAALPQASAFLIDRAGRIVDVPRKPPGVDLEAISALAAGVHASTQELAESLGDRGFALLFEHGDDRQVYVWPILGRALLVVLMKGAVGVEQLEQQMEGPLGKELEAVVQEARDPLQTVAAPRIEPHQVPPEITAKVHSLNAMVTEMQGKNPVLLSGENGARLLRAREVMVQTASKQDWERTSSICDQTTAWLNTLKNSQVQ